MVGGIRSLVHVTVLEVVAVLPQASTAVNVLVWDLAQLVEVMVPSTELIVGAPHASEAVAEPSAALISDGTGLHPSVVVVPVAVIDGAVTSAVHVTVLDVVAVLPQTSIAVNVLVCDLPQDVVTIVASTELTVGVPQASVAVAVPRAALISETTGLHPRTSVVPVAVIAGGVRSAVHVTILEVVAVLPQPSTAVNVLI